MEDERTSNRSLWIVLAILVGALLICGLGALAGGAAGYLVGRKAVCEGREIEEHYELDIERGRPELPGLSPRIPMPHMPEGFPFGERIGALVLEVDEDGPAAEAGLRDGDIIWRIDGDAIEEGDDLSERILEYEPGDEVELGISRGRRERTIEVTLARHPRQGGETPYLGVGYRMLSTSEFDMPFMPE